MGHPKKEDASQNRQISELYKVWAKVNPMNQTIEAFATFSTLPPELLAGMSGTAVFSPPSTHQ